MNRNSTPNNCPGPPGYIVVTDAVPLREGGHGCSVLAILFTEVFRDRIKLVFTHHFGLRISRSAIRSQLGVPIVFYPQVPHLPGGTVIQAACGLINVALFGLWLAVRGWRTNRKPQVRFLVLFGGNGWFLFQMFLLGRTLPMPMDVYLVDDLEESARLNGSSLTARLFRWMEPRFLRRADRVFAISPGYCQHLKAKYGVVARSLPVPVNCAPLAFEQFVPLHPDVRRIVFLGAVNQLYAAALRDLLGVIGDWNSARHNNVRLRLSLLTYSSVDYIQQQLGQCPDLEIHRGLDTQQRISRLRSAWAIFLPYSFDERVRVMASTSFPSKISEAYAGGRPLLAYGPRHSSISRYFADHGLPLSATTLGELKEAVRTLCRWDRPELIEQYGALVRDVHSAGALRATVAVAPVVRDKELSV